MRLTLIHDANGKISTVIARSASAGPAGRATMPAGERATEIDAPDITPHDNKKLADLLNDIVDNQVVDVKSAAPRLARKGDLPAKK
jgi:hypothetical protein